MVKDSNKRRHKIIAIFKEAFDGSSIHSFPNIVRTDYISIKVIWTICLFISYGYCGYSTTQAFISFFKYDVVSTTRENYENPISIPVVTICSLNYFGNAFANFNPEMLNIYQQMLKEDQTNASKSLEYLVYRFKAISLTDYLNETFKDQLSMNINVTILSCIFNNVDCIIETDFIQYYDNFYGKCFKFNSDYSKNVSVSGSMNGLQLELFTDAAESNDNIFSMYNGFNVFITNETSFNAYNYDGVNVAPGFSTNVILSKYSISKKPIPYSECNENLIDINSYPSRVYKITFELNGNFYSRDKCLNMCFQFLVGSNCDCYDAMSGPFPSEKKPCLSITDTECKMKSLNQYISEELFNKCDCPFECETTGYTYMTSVSEYPTYAYYQYLLTDPAFVARFPNQTEITYNDVKSRVASVNVYYNELIKTDINEDIKEDTFGLISNIGGILSLFLGLSFLSFVEFVEVMLLTIYTMYEERKVKPAAESQIKKIFVKSLDNSI